MGHALGVALIVWPFASGALLALHRAGRALHHHRRPMHFRITATEIAHTLTDRQLPNATTGPAWRPGHRATQASPTTIRLWHDGPDETSHLDEYATVLRTGGYTVTAERPAGQRPRLRVTRQPAS